MDKNRLREMPVIELENIILRPVISEDYKDMYEYGISENVTRWVRWGPYKSIEDAIYSVEKIMLTRPDRGLPSTYAIVFKENNKMIGTIGFPSVDFEIGVAEIGYVINENYWSKGIVSEAAKEVIDIGFNYLNLKKIVACHLPGNIGSKKVLLRSGFRYVKEVYDKRSGSFLPWYELER